MVTDYLRNLLQTSTYKGELKHIERDLISLLDKLNWDIDDTAILNRLKALRQKKNTIEVSDFGAGSKRNNGTTRQISNIAKHASIQPKHGRLFAALINKFDIALAVELGTSFGIGTAYLAVAANKVITMEGCPNIASIALETFSEIGAKNIELQIGEFSNLLEQLQDLGQKPIFVYIDGNHAKAPTLAYFEYFKKKLPSNSILVFDDIYWSKDMKAAWRAIQAEPFFTIDLYRVGVVLLSKRTKPLALKLRY
jgi:predicted O-methyltransferase YrrM